MCILSDFSSHKEEKQQSKAYKALKSIDPLEVNMILRLLVA